MQSYNGGNKQPSERETMAKDLQRIRQTIFQSPTGDISGERRSKIKCRHSCLFALSRRVDIIDLTTDAGQYGTSKGLLVVV